MDGPIKWYPRWHTRRNVGFLKLMPASIPVEALAEPDVVHLSYWSGTSDGPAEIARAHAEFPDLYQGEP